MKEKILVVDDEKEIAELLKVILENDGYEVCVFYDGKSAVQSILNQDYDLALLDVMLPKMDGFSLCQMIRKDHLYPIIMLTAKVEDTDKILGLSLGADDYITKPFNPLEVLARVKSQIRRYKRYNPSEPPVIFEIEIHGLVINQKTHTCHLYGKTIELTPLEFSILWHLASHRGQVISSEDLFEAVWKEKYMDCNNTVMAHIARLREKLHEPSKNPKFIKTVWGVGYKID